MQPAVLNPEFGLTWEINVGANGALREAPELISVSAANSNTEPVVPPHALSLLHSSCWMLEYGRNPPTAGSERFTAAGSAAGSGSSGNVPGGGIGSDCTKICLFGPEPSQEERFTFICCCFYRFSGAFLQSSSLKQKNTTDHEVISSQILQFVYESEYLGQSSFTVIGC